MKKAFLFLLAAIILLTAGCAGQQPAETTAPSTTAETTLPPATEAPTEPMPETRDAQVLADQVPAILMFKNRGDTLDVAGEYDEDHYVVKTDAGYGLVPKTLLRPEGMEAYQVWTGYAAWNAGLFDNFYLSGEPEKLPQNTEIEVLEELGTCFYVKAGEAFGYMEQKQVSKWPASSGGGDSGDSGGSGGSGGGGGGQDGGDIVMQVRVISLAIIDQTGEITGQAEVLADRTPVILGYFDRGDQVPVVQDTGFAPEKTGYALLYWDGIYAYMQMPLLRKADAEAYAAWDGFVAMNGKCYFNYHLTGDPMPNIWTNIPVRILEDLGDVYLVEINETVGYMGKDQVSETRIPITYGGGDSGGGDSGGGGGGGQEWSDPVL